MSKKINERRDFLSEAEQIKVMGGTSETSSMGSENEVIGYIGKKCGWKDCKKICATAVN